MLRRSFVAPVLALLVGVAARPLRADVVFDGSLGGPAGRAQVVNDPKTGVPDYQIPASAGTAAAGSGGSNANLFHSFSVFGIEAGRSATFFNDTTQTFTNVIARVTGGSPSLIAGLLRSKVAGADLWLLNPAGVLFANGAKVQVPAGLHVSTADSIRFGDGKSFAATPQMGEVLTAATPAAFGFLGPTAGDIAVQQGAVVAVNPGNVATIAPLDLAGGNVAIAGTVRTSNGGVSVEARDLIDVRDGGALLASASEGGATLTLDARGVKVHDTVSGRVGPVSRVSLFVFDPDAESSLRIHAETVDVHDSAFVVTNATRGPSPFVRIDARSVDLTGGGTIGTQSNAGTRSGDVIVNASEQVRLGDRTADNQWAGISTQTRSDESAGDITIRTPLLGLAHEGMVTARTNGNGSGGRIELDVGRLQLEDGSRIEVDSSGAGRPGTLVVHASDTVSLEGTQGVALDELMDPTSLSATAAETGGGRIEIDAPLLLLRRGSVIDGRSNRGTTGDAATILLRVDRLDMGGSYVVADSQGSGRAGTVDVQASDTVQLTGAHIDSRTYGSGAGGRVAVTAPVVVLAADSQIATDAAQKFLDVPGGGASGTIELSVGRLLVDSSVLRATSRGTELGGNIHVRASDAVTLETSPDDPGHPGQIVAVAEGDGPAGDIQIETPHLFVGEFARIETSTTGASGDEDRVVRSGDAGDVRIVADDVVVAPHARIASDSRGRPENLGNAGTVDLEVGSLSMPGNGEIQASTSTRGRGGAVIVRASRGVTMSLDAGRHADIASTTERSTGSGGSVLVEAPSVELRGGAGIGATSTGAGDAGSVTVRAARILISDGSEIASDALGTGRAGPVRVQARDALVVEGSNEVGPSGIATRSGGPAAGGSIEIAAGTLQLRNGGSVSAASTGTGDAGDVSIDVAGRFTASGGSIATSAPQADGGNITLRVGDRAELHDSRIAADVTGGRGGNILAQAASLILEGSGITAQAGSGQGGTIRIVADVVIQSQDSIISAAAGASGINGTVRIETPEREVTKRLEAMPVEFVDAVTLLHERCAARRGATASFVVADAAPASSTSGELLPVVVVDRAEAPAEVERVALVVEPGSSETPPTWRIACGG